jgi:hypothetical protein
MKSSCLPPSGIVAKHYEHIVTFNGRSFDVPFLYLRSALLNVAISRKDWLGYRFQTEPHCDLAEQLTFYGVSGREGAARPVQSRFLLQSLWDRVTQKPRHYWTRRQFTSG